MISVACTGVHVGAGCVMISVACTGADVGVAGVGVEHAPSSYCS